jgi:hypothetical protein
MARVRGHGRGGRGVPGVPPRWGGCRAPGRGLPRRAHALSLRDTLGPGHRVVFVDDWAEQGAQAKAVHQLVLGTGANWLGASLIVDQLTSEVRSQVGPVTFLVTAQELGQSAG